MAEFQVWAPLPRTVAIEVAGRRHAMIRGVDGWWAVEVKSADAGIDYGFVMDGAGPFPDPRSRWQPHGVHGLSRLVDHRTFEWSDAGFRAPPLGDAVIYELHIGTFTPEGTFDSAIGRLEHLVRLGVTHVELMPVNAFPGEHGWGYDGVCLFAPQHAYGGPGGLKRFVDACHSHGLAVLLDVVYNHLGPSGNYLGMFAPYFTDRHHTPWGPAVNLDGPGSDEVGRYFCDNALMWLRDYHCDGLRLDAVHAMPDPAVRSFLERLATEVKQLSVQLGRPLVLIAESDLNDPRLVWPVERGGCGLDAQWNDDFHHALHTALTGERAGYYRDFSGLPHLAKALRHAYVYDGCHSQHRGRRHGQSPEGLSAHHFLAYAQNHDQVGNRARGERLSHLVRPGRLKIAAALVLTSPFVPLIFQGEEWAASSPFQYFTDHPEPELARAVREGRRREFAAFGWKPADVPDPQARETFERSRLRWDELGSGLHAEMLDWHRRLIRLRRTGPALADGALENVTVRCDESAAWLLLERGPLAVACNLAGNAQSVALDGPGWSVILSSAPGVETVAATLRLPADSVAVLKRS